ncbi:hypothetical protein F5Y14DRAFT_453613 [Nemania sp. NC0429]|nr:hypothetical protein F5Y14DRAFT_453613 [Nemania sp. NC0429]
MRSQSMLENLPLEVIFIILGCLSHHSLLSLRLVSKFLSNQVTSRVFSDLSLAINDLNKDRFHRNLWLVKHLATTCSPINSAVRTLRIKSLYSPRYRELSGGGRALRDDEPGPNEHLVQATLSEHLARFLLKLQNLETVFWNYDAKRDPECYLAPVAQSLSSPLKLRSLYVAIELANSGHPEPQLPPLQGFKHLLEFSISSDCTLPAPYWENEVGPVVRASQELASFSLVLKNGHKAAPPPLHAIMGEVPRPNLERLALEHVALPSPGLYPFCTKNLKELTLLTSPGPRGPAVAWPSVWTALRNVGAELLSLSISVFEEGVDDMFNYLLSYSALRKLEITQVQMDAQSAEDAAGDVFWNTIVPQHKNTLVDLVVLPVYEGSWCYGQAASSAIRQCTSLKRLDLRLRLISDGWVNDEIVRLREDSDIKFPDQEINTYEPIQYCPDIRAAGSVLQELLINITKPAERRDTDMLHLQQGTRPKGSRELNNLRAQMRRLLGEVKSGLCSMQLPYYTGRAWPTVQIGYGMILRWREHVAREDLSSGSYGTYVQGSA